MPDKPLPDRLDRLRRWRDAAAPTAELVIDWHLIDHMLDLIDNLPGPYKAKTSVFNRAELYTVIRQAGTGSAIDLLRDVLQDLENAEAALKGGQL